MAGRPTCAETAAALSDFEEGILPVAQFVRVRAHLFHCPPCRALLATLRALPGVTSAALRPDPDFRSQARLALEGALVQMARPNRLRAWPATPVPLEARQVLEADPDSPMRLLALTHDLIARERQRRQDPAEPLPQAALDLLPPPGQWPWQETKDGVRLAELLTSPAGGPRLLLVLAPADANLAPHRHLGSESILVLAGTMVDQDRERGRGDWMHHANGSCHAPRFGPRGCCCLIREEGTARRMSPAAWGKHLETAS